MGDNAGWIDQLLANLDRSGPSGRATYKFLKEKRVRVELHEQPTGARWTATGRIQLHPRYAEGPPDAAYPLSLIVHEACHLQQAMWKALSVYGEWQAWQEQFSFHKALFGSYHEVPHKNEIIEELMSISSGWDRSGLDRARKLMRVYAGNAYRVDLLPLYPLPAEIMFWISGRVPRAP